MARSEMEFTQNTEPAVQFASVGISWFRQIAERNLKQGRESLEELFKVNRKMADAFGDQASAFCNHSMSLAEQTLSNTFDCGISVLRLKEPQELAQVQTDFVSRQAQAFADQTKQLNQRFTKGAESAGRQAKAA